MTDIVISKDKLIQESTLSPVENGFNYALKGYDGSGNNGASFWGNESVFENNPVTIDIDLPDGTWILAATPTKGWARFLDQDKTLNYILLISSLIISTLFWLLIKTQLKVRANEKELKAIFNSMHNLIIEFNNRGEYIKIAPTNKKLLFKAEKELIGKTVHEVFEKDLADILLGGIRECLQTKDLVVIEYQMNINGEMRWFSARISYKSEDSVIFNAYDITDKKNDEESIRQSEKRLKNLNEVKDKFFSIIAHDLRSPVGSFRNITELLTTDFDSYNDEEKKKFLSIMQVSSSNLTDLLENLLEWSHTQRDTIVLSPKATQISGLCNQVIETLAINSEVKNIRINNQIPDECIAFCDRHATMSIIRNLLSNAIKFTHENGEICLRCNLISTNENEFYQISIHDNGIGIPSDKLKLMFELNRGTTHGTNNESGSGLGLVLSKEFVERQGGEISIESELQKGTTVIFTLPKK